MRVLIGAGVGAGGRNPYLRLLRTAMPAWVQFVPYRPGVVLAGRFDIVHMHWPEIVLRASSAPRRAAKYLIFAVLLLHVRLRRVPLVRTVHNVQPHEELGAIASWLTRRCDALTTRRIYLAGAGMPADRPGVVVPHGHFLDLVAANPPSATRQPGRLLFFGNIRRYKGVPDLLAAFAAFTDAEASLVIAGDVADAHLGEQIRHVAATQPRVTAQLRFHTDAELIDLIAAAELTVLPYRDMYNSSVLFLSLCVGTPVLVPRSEVNVELATEFGDDWVLLYDGTLAPRHLADGLARVRRRDATARPDLSARNWSTIAAATAAVYDELLARRRQSAVD